MQEANAIVESEIIVTCCMFEPGGLDETNGREIANQSDLCNSKILYQTTDIDIEDGKKERNLEIVAKLKRREPQKSSFIEANLRLTLNLLRYLQSHASS